MWCSLYSQSVFPFLLFFYLNHYLKKKHLLILYWLEFEIDICFDLFQVIIAILKIYSNILLVLDFMIKNSILLFSRDWRGPRLADPWLFNARKPSLPFHIIYVLILNHLIFFFFDISQYFFINWTIYKKSTWFSVEIEDIYKKMNNFISKIFF